MAADFIAESSAAGLVSLSPVKHEVERERLKDAVFYEAGTKMDISALQRRLMSPMMHIICLLRI